ncbi:hypothetical protein THRCLA_03855, partial [Thraustotheca clavata]
PTAAIVTQIQQAPGLKVTIQAKRSSMEFNGQTSATVYLVPRSASGANLDFDAYLSQPGPNVTANFMLLNNRAYWSFVKDNAVVSAGCLASNQVPPVQLMQASLESSVVVTSVTGQTIDCPQGKLLQLVFAGEKFVFCNSNTNQLTKAVGEDLDMTIEYLSDPTLIPDFDVPQVPGSSTPLDCPVVTSESSVESSTSRRLESASALRRTAALGSSSCGCKGQMKPCLFVHGVGEKSSAPPTSTYSDTWGDVQNHAPCCSSFAFAHYESVQRAWNDPSSQQEFCQTALKVGTSGGTTVDNMILVTYSMGNLVASGAVASGRCSFGSGVSWISIAGPMQGSKAANVLDSKCASGNGWDSALKGILGLIGYCPATPAYLNMKTQDTVNSGLYNNYISAQSVRSRTAKRVLCGIKSSGLVSIDAAALALVGQIVYNNDGTLHDGVVSFPSCSVGFGNFANDASNSNANYQASINHLDSSFRNGDGWWGADRKPLKWFECTL